jgi:lysophospholipase L1-like esterase
MQVRRRSAAGSGPDAYNAGVLEIVVVILLIVVVCFWLLLRLSPLMGQPHQAQLERFHSSLAADRQKVVICLGDSLTEGRFSFDYVAELARRLEPWGYSVLNAGLDSELAWNVLQRAPSIVEAEPAYVVLMVGSNDARALEDEGAADYYVRDQALPQTPDEAFFRESYGALLDTLESSSCAKQILLTIPMIGEREGEPIDTVVGRINEVVEKEAERRGLPCLPFNALLRQQLEAEPNERRPAYVAGSTRRRVFVAAMLHYVLGWSWDRVSRTAGMTLLTDCVHLNDRAGQMLVDLVEAQIRSLPAVDC